MKMVMEEEEEDIIPTPVSRYEEQFGFNAAKTRNGVRHWIDIYLFLWVFYYSITISASSSLLRLVRELYSITHATPYTRPQITTAKKFRFPNFTKKFQDIRCTTRKCPRREPSSDGKKPSSTIRNFIVGKLNRCRSPTSGPSYTSTLESREPLSKIARTKFPTRESSSIEELANMSRFFFLILSLSLSINIEERDIHTNHQISTLSLSHSLVR